MSSAVVDLRLDGRDLLLVGPAELHDRRSRRFFRTILGGEITTDGWRISARNQPTAQLVLRVDRYINQRGWTPNRDDLVARDIEFALERRRSFERTAVAAREWKAGKVAITEAELEESLRQFGWSDARKLRAHQRSGATHAITAGNSANFSVPGSGKTTTALAVATSHMAAGTVDLVLVVGPLACFEPWETETQAALPGKLMVTRVRGTRDQRLEMYARARSATILLVGYQAATTDQQPIFDLAERLNVMLVVDESHRAKRFRGGSWAPALIAIAKRCKTRIVLSGTPMPKSPLDLYSQLNIIWPDGQLTGTADDFEQRADADFPKLRAKVAPFTIRTPKADLGLPPYTIKTHEVELDGTQAEIYDLIASRFRRTLADAPIWEEKLTTLRRARPIRLLQAATNPDLLNRNDKLYETPRVPADSPTLMERLARFSTTEVPSKYVHATELVAAITGAGRKVVCWSNFVANLDQWRRHLEHELDVACYQVDGRIPVDDGIKRSKYDDLDETREQILQHFLTYDGPAVFITNPASCSESISLHHACHDAIYLDRTYDAALYLQSIDRIHRLGLPTGADVTIHLLLATHDSQPTIDHLVDNSLTKKRGAMEEVLQGAELHPSVYELSRPEGTDDDLSTLLRYLLGE